MLGVTIAPVRPGVELNTNEDEVEVAPAVVELDGEEAKHTKGLRAPVKPIKQEREDHERDHILLRS